MPHKRNRTEPGYDLDQGGFIGKTPESRKKALKRGKSLGQARREMHTGKDSDGDDISVKDAIKGHQKRSRKGVAYS